MANAQAAQRSTNMDVIRCIALFFVLAVHFCTHCNIYNAGYTGFMAFFADTLRTLYVPALSLFLMLNGYFQYKRSLSAPYYLGILRLYEMYLLCSVLNLLYNRFYLGMEMSLRDMVSAIVNYSASEYSWYILLYNGLFLLIPFLNLSYNGLAHRGQKRILVLTLFFISALPASFLNAFISLHAYWWQRLWPILFYFMGAYMGEYRPKLRPRTAGLIFLASLLLFSGYNYLVYNPGSPLFGHSTRSFLYAHESLQNAVMTPLLFLWIMNLDMSRWPKAICSLSAIVSKYSYGAFLFSSITDSFVYLWLCRLVPGIGLRYLFFPIFLPLSYVSAVFLSYLGDKLVGLIDRILRPAARALIQLLYRTTAPDAAAAEQQT